MPARARRRRTESRTRRPADDAIEPVAKPPPRPNAVVVQLPPGRGESRRQAGREARGKMLSRLPPPRCPAWRARRRRPARAAARSPGGSASGTAPTVQTRLFGGRHGGRAGRGVRRCPRPPRRSGSTRSTSDRLGRPVDRRRRRRAGRRRAPREQDVDRPPRVVGDRGRVLVRVEVQVVIDKRLV